jgi:hypothetical protein
MMACGLHGGTQPRTNAPVSNLPKPQRGCECFAMKNLSKNTEQSSLESMNIKPLIIPNLQAVNIHQAHGTDDPSSPTGFGPPVPPPPLPAELKDMYEECMQIYTLIARHKITAAPPSIPPAPSGGTPSRKGGTHKYEPDPRNADILVGMRDGMTGKYTLVRRTEAKVVTLSASFGAARDCEMSFPGSHRWSPGICESRAHQNV